MRRRYVGLLAMLALIGAAWFALLSQTRVLTGCTRVGTAYNVAEPWMEYEQEACDRGVIVLRPAPPPSGPSV